MKDNINKMVKVLLSIFSIIVININFTKDMRIITYNNGNSIIPIFLLTFLIIGVRYVENIKDKRLNIITTLIGIILAVFEVIGQAINQNLDLTNLYIAKTNIVITISMIISYAFIIKIILTVAFKKFENFKEKGTIVKKMKNKNNIIWLLIPWIIILLAWIPYLLTYFPGNITPDSVAQLDQAAGISQWYNHHPFFHTILITIAIKMGLLINNNYNTGVAIYSIIQMIALSGTFAFSIYYMNRKKVNKIYCIILTIIYAIYPVNALYSITMWKDIPFAISMLILTIFLTEFATNKDNLFKSKLRMILFIVSLILVILFRNNGIYVVLLALPFLFIFGKKYWKKICIIVLVVLAFFMIYKYGIFKIVGVKEGSIKEALSIPLQQFARIARDRDNELTLEEKEGIYKFLPVENIGEFYNPKISDQVKNRFDDKAFKENKLEFVRLYIHFAIKYPIDTIEAFASNSYGYYYPEAIHWVVAREVYETDCEAEKQLELKGTPIKDIKLIRNANSIIDRRDIPVISMIFSIGFTFWMIIISFAYTIYTKRYYLIVIYIPILLLWLTTLASPVYGEYRYVYSLFTCLGIIIGTNLTRKNI